VLTPAVRRLIKELNLDPTQIKGTGKNGRILKSDVMAWLDAHPPKQDPDAESVATTVRETAGAAVQEAPLEQRVPMSRLRARIAERLVEAQQTAAILTTFNEVNLQAVIDLRSRYRERFEQEHGVRLGFMSFFVKASVEALKRFPILNASVDGHDIIYHGYYDIGIAVGSPRGLVVPILRGADRLSFAEIEKAIRQFGQKAKEGTLSYEELQGGTFTISNGGVYGSLLSTPILNPPQSGILGMHKIQERPVAENGQVVIRPMMYLALSYDHRIVDGKDAVQFLVTIKELLEDPSRLLLDL
jgi:2-oxoglutarate dehydrogenase complex dihydrolipoamide succinyltransferase (E2 component)